MVNAAAAAVFCTSIACMVGAAGVPHALMSTAITATVRVERCFILCECLLMNLAIGVTTAKCVDAVIFYNNFPIAFCDVEATKGFEILFAGDKCSGAVLSNWTGKAITRDDQVSTLTEGCDRIHGQDDSSFRLGLVGDGEIRGGTLPGSEGLIANILTVCICRSIG